MIINREQISQHITYKEGIYSATAKKYGIDNTPSDMELFNMQYTAVMGFEPVRHHYREPIAVNSFFRNLEVNTRIGGSKTSKHMSGLAIDIDDTLQKKNGSPLRNVDFFNFIKENLIFDTLIWEFGDDNNPSWIHIDFQPFHKSGFNKQRVLRAIKENGKTKYLRIN